MAKPVKIIEILSQQTASENIQCDQCDGTGETIVLSQETGYDLIECDACLGSGYNQLGLILRGILKPPADGYGPVELKEALALYIAESERKHWVAKTNEAIRDAEQVIAETQDAVEKAKACLVAANQQRAHRPEAGEPTMAASSSASHRKIS